MSTHSYCYLEAGGGTCLDGAGASVHLNEPAGAVAHAEGQSPVSAPHKLGGVPIMLSVGTCPHLLS